MQKRICGQNFIPGFFFALSIYLFAFTPLYAETQPKFALSPTTATAATILSSQTLTVVYRVTNKTKITRQLTMTPIEGGSAADKWLRCLLESLYTSL